MEGKMDEMLSLMSDSLELRVKLRKVIEEIVYLENGETQQTRIIADELFSDINEKLSKVN